MLPPFCGQFTPLNLTIPAFEADIFITGHCIPSSLKVAMYFIGTLVFSGIGWTGIIAARIRCRRLPAFKTMLAYKIVLLASVNSLLFSLMYTWLLLGLSTAISPVLFGLAMEVNMIYLTVGTYSIILLLDGISLSGDTKQKVKEVAKTLKRQLIIGRVLIGLINLTLWSLATVFIIFYNPVYQVICVILAYVLTISNVLHSTWTQRAQGKLLIEALKTNTANQEKYTTHSTGSSEKTNQLIEVTRKIETGIADGTKITVTSCIYLLSIIIWAASTINADAGMAWSSIVLWVGLLLFTAPGLWLSIYIHAVKVPDNQNKNGHRRSNSAGNGQGQSVVSKQDA